MAGATAFEGGRGRVGEWTARVMRGAGNRLRPPRSFHRSVDLELPCCGTPGAPSDRVLTREIKAAEIVRIPLSQPIAADPAELLRSCKANVFGADSGVAYPAAEALIGAKIVRGAFGTVLVAAALPHCRRAALRPRKLYSPDSSTKQNR